MNNSIDIKSCLLRIWVLLLSPIIYLLIFGTFILIKIAQVVFAKKHH